MRTLRFRSTTVKFIVFIWMFLLISCDQDKPLSRPIYADKNTTYEKAVYIFSTHPLFSEQRVFELFTPLIKLLNESAQGFRFDLETAPDYAFYEKKLSNRRYHFSLPNPLQTLDALKRGYHVFGKVMDDTQFRGIILAPKTSNIKSVADLKGKKISFPSQTALAACMLPQVFLVDNGLNIQQDIHALYTGNQESAIFAAYSGISDVAVTWPPPWQLFQKRHPNEAAALHILWETPTLVNVGLVVRDDVPQTVRDYFATKLFSLKDNPRGRAILKSMSYAGFEEATEQNYEIVQTFLKKYSIKVQLLENF